MAVVDAPLPLVVALAETGSLMRAESIFLAGSPPDAA